jgi:N-acetylglucosaminyldiphosphoundecaprenol N-acetyl-beta-D-mannosaminyltransferase
VQQQRFIQRNPSPPLTTVTLYDIPILAATEQQCVEYIMNELESSYGGWCVTVNLDILRQIALNADTRSLLGNSNLFTADGISLVLASKLRGTPLPARVCGCDLIYSLSEEAARRARSIFLLGGNPNTAKKAAEVLQQRYQNLHVAGTYCPTVGFEEDPQQMEAIIEQIRVSRPDIVYVALGFPKQERLIAKLRPFCPKAWWMGVGISFSYVAGEFKRAPLWIQKSGLETFYRLTLEPKRLAKRYLFWGPLFVIKFLSLSFLERFKLRDRAKTSKHKSSRSNNKSKNTFEDSY